MRSPLEIHAEKSLLQKLSIGALAALGGGALAYLAGPGMYSTDCWLLRVDEYFVQCRSGLLLVGAVEALNVTGAVAAGTAGTLGTGLVAARLLTQALADKNYVQVLRCSIGHSDNVERTALM